MTFQRRQGLSTLPITSRNALKTGLTGRTVLLPSEDAALYEAHLAQFRERYQPVGDQELALVQSLADTHWRIARIPSLELAIFTLGRLEFAELFPDQEEDARKSSCPPSISNRICSMIIGPPNRRAAAMPWNSTFH